MDPTQRDDLEARLRDLHARGDLEGAATAALKGYGSEIFGFLVAMHRDEEDAAEAFSSFGEDLWRGLPGFGWKSSFRTWAYTLARHAAFRQKKGDRRRAKRGIALDECPSLSAVEEQIRSATMPFLRTEVKDRFAVLRDALPPDDRSLLILRVDKKLAWLDLARITLGDEADDEAIKRESARLRKRFQLVKERLVDAARREGIIPRDDG